MKIVCGLIITLTLLSCGGRSAHLQEGGDSIPFKYATLPSIVKYDGYTVVTLANPWKEGKALHTYVLVPSNAPLPVHLPKGTVEAGGSLHDGSLCLVDGTGMPR